MEASKERDSRDSSGCVTVASDFSVPSGWPMTARARPLVAAEVLGRADAQLLNARPFGGLVCLLETIREKGGAAVASMTAAARSVSHCSRAPARFPCKSSATEFANPTRALGASADAPLLRLSRVLSCAAVACRRPAQRGRQRHRTARVTTSARGARPATDAPFVPDG